MDFEKVKKAGKALLKASNGKSARLFSLIHERPSIFQKELSRLSGFSQVETSTCLKALLECKIIAQTKMGTKVYYTENSANVEKINALAALINT